MNRVLKNLNPFRGLANPREVWAWGMYDLANQSFTLLINTLLFAVYFKEVVVGDQTEALSSRGTRLWGAIVTISMLTVVLISPFVGALADGRGWKKRVLMGTGFVCVALTCGFGLIRPGNVLLAILLYIPANIAYQIGENFLASFIPEVAAKRHIGRVSAIGWTMGYLGALMLLVSMVIAMYSFGLVRTEHWRPLFVFAGLWFLMGMMAPLLILRETPPTAIDANRSAASEAWRRMRETLRGAARYKELMRFLIAFFLYGMGVQTVIFFAAVIGKETVWANDPIANQKLVGLAALLTLTAFPAALGSGSLQDRLGTKATLYIFLCVWIVGASALAAFRLSPAKAEWVFWVIGALLGVGLGGVGTASRAMVGRFTPRHKTAEFFGLWGMVYKLAAVVGVFIFSQVRALNDAVSLFVLIAYFVVGLIAFLGVNEVRGVRAARRAERQAGLEDHWLERAATRQIAARTE